MSEFNIPEGGQHDFNRTVQEATQHYLDDIAPQSPLSQGSQADMIPAITSQDDLIKNGYVLPNGDITDRGDLLVNLQNAGTVGHDGLLTDKGRIYNMRREDVLKPENVAAFKTQTEDGLMGPDMGVMDYAAAGLGSLWSAVKGLGDLAGSGVMHKDHDAENLIKNTSVFEGLGKAVMNSGALLNKAADLLPNTKSGISMLDSVIPDSWKSPEQIAQHEIQKQKNENDFWLAKQDHAATDDRIQNFNIGKIASHVTALQGLVDAQSMAEASLPPERVAELKGNQTALTSLLGDPLMYVGIGEVGAAAKAGESVGAAMRIAPRLAEEQSRLASANFYKASLAPKLESSLEIAARSEERAASLNAVGLTKQAETAKVLADVHNGVINQISPRLAEADAQIARSTKNIERYQQFPGAPAMVDQLADVGRKVVSTGGESIGNGLNTIGEWAQKAYEGTIGVLDTKVGGFAGKMMSAAKIGGAISHPGMAMATAAATTAAKYSGSALQSFGNISRIIGQESLERAGQIPFWQRVAKFDPSPELIAQGIRPLGKMGQNAAHLMDYATQAGLFVGGVSGDVAKGAFHAAPAALGFGIVQNDGQLNADTLKQAAGQALVFGGAGRALGGLVHDSPTNLRASQLGDEVNFREGLVDPTQKAGFTNMPAGVRRGLSTYAAAYPEVKWNFDGPHNFYDSTTNTIHIDPKSSNPIGSVVAHEANHQLLAKTGMEAGVASYLVGDGVSTGGILRDKNGNLDKSFAQFKDVYNDRLKMQADRDNLRMQPLTDSQMAVEYYVDSHAGQMMDKLQDGSLARQARSFGLRSLVDKISGNTSAISDLHMKMGGAWEPNGRIVQGSGLAADGILETVEGRAMHDKMVRDSLGWRRSNKPGSPAAAIPERAIDHSPGAPIHDSLTSSYELDGDNNVARTPDGKPIFISPAVDKAREFGGLELKKIQEDFVAAGGALEPNEIHFNPETKSWVGTTLSDRAILGLSAYNPLQINRLIESANDIKNGTGRMRMTVYTKELATQPKDAKVVVHKIEVSKKGSILIHMVDVDQLHENIRDLASLAGSKKVGADVHSIYADVQKATDIQQSSMNPENKIKATDNYFSEAYGKNWQARKNIANAAFGSLSKAHMGANSLLSNRIPRSAFKTHRLDRLHKSTQLSPDDRLFINHAKIVTNFLPDSPKIK